MADLFSPLALRSIEFRNRIAVSPMCQYSSEDGFADDWHLVHLGAFAKGGAGLVMVEATAVEPRGRITPNDLGLWKDEHIEALLRTTEFMRKHGAVPGIQLAHAGIKASRARPWARKSNAFIHPTGSGGPDDGWVPVGPTSRKFEYPADDDGLAPHALTAAEIAEVTAQFAASASRALAAGFRVIEIHAAHGYLLHSFLSPITNTRSDEYGGGFEGRTRMLREVVSAVRMVMPEALPLFVRFSASDWVESGWTIKDSVRLAKELKGAGVDLIDCSSGGATRGAKIPTGPGYQVPFAEEIRRDAEIATGAVGGIAEPRQADEIIQENKADIVLIGRAHLIDPHWSIRAARELGVPVEGVAALPIGWAIRAF